MRDAFNSEFVHTASRQLEIRYDQDLPAEIREAMRPYLEKYAWLVPSFVHYVFVCWSEGASRDLSLSTTVLEDYRRMNLYIHPGWVSQSERSRHVDVQHEFCHAFATPLTDHIDRLVALLKPDDKLAELLREQFRAANEKVTCDIQNMLDRREMFG